MSSNPLYYNACLIFRVQFYCTQIVFFENPVSAMALGLNRYYTTFNLIMQITQRACHLKYAQKMHIVFVEKDLAH